MQRLTEHYLQPRFEVLAYSVASVQSDDDLVGRSRQAHGCMQHDRRVVLWYGARRFSSIMSALRSIAARVVRFISFQRVVSLWHWGERTSVEVWRTPRLPLNVSFVH